MNKLWQVGRTYWQRPRFWVFGAIYLLPALWLIPLLPHGNKGLITVNSVLFSVLPACILSALVALYVRRQFSTAVAHLAPSFAAVHLTVAAVISALIWLVVPSVEAWRSEMPQLPAIGAHAMAGILLASVIVWPKSALLIFFLFFGFTDRFYDRSMAFAEGHYPLTAMILIAAAVVLQAIAAMSLLRLSDQSIAASDDFAVEVGRDRRRVTGWFNERLLSMRDSQLAWHIARPGGLFWRARRWQLPGIVSWTEIACWTPIVLIAMLASYLYFQEPYYPAAVGAIAGAITLLIPFNGWRFQCNSLAYESTRPVTRTQFVRQMTTGMAFDALFWTLVASIAVIIGQFAYLSEAKERMQLRLVYEQTAWVLAVLWSLAALLFGLAVATMRFRYWVPLLFGALIGILWLTAACAILAVATFDLGLRIVDPTRSSPTLNSAWLPATFLLMIACVGILLVANTYRRWQRIDLN